MKKYWSLFRIRMINSLQHRAVALGLILTRFCWALMEILAFAALYRTGKTNFSMTLEQIASYIWLQQGLYTLFLVVYGDGDIYESIRTGSIAYELVRPADLYNRWFCQAAANRISPLFVGFLPTLVLALLMPAPLRLVLPGSVWQFGLFLLSAVLALGVTVAVAMLMHMTMFFTLSHRGIRVVTTAVTSFLSGGVIPLAFFPEPVRRVAELLPFAAMQNMPLRIYTGNFSGAEALSGVALQLFWLAALVVLGKLWMHTALRRVVVQGG